MTESKGVREADDTNRSTTMADYDALLQTAARRCAQARISSESVFADILRAVILPELEQRDAAIERLKRNAKTIDMIIESINRDVSHEYQKANLENCNLESEIKRLKTIANARLCDACMERHPIDTPCPPHEVRTTGQQWFRERIAEKDAVIERLKAEVSARTKERNYWHGWVQTIDPINQKLRSDRDVLCLEAERLKTDLQHATESAGAADSSAGIAFQNAENTVLHQKVETLMALLKAVQHQVGNSAVDDRRHALSSVIRDAIDDALQEPTHDA